MQPVDSVEVEIHERITVVSIARPDVCNAVDGETAAALAAAFAAFDDNPDSDVAILHGQYGTFCAGADLKAVAAQRGPTGCLHRATDPWGPRECCSVNR